MLQRIAAVSVLHPVEPLMQRSAERLRGPARWPSPPRSSARGRLRAEHLAGKPSASDSPAGERSGAPLHVAAAGPMAAIARLGGTLEQLGYPVLQGG